MLLHHQEPPIHFGKALNDAKVLVRLLVQKNPVGFWAGAGMSAKTSATDKPRAQ